MARSWCRCWAGIAARTGWRAEVAEALGGVAAVTTAGDVALGVALDEPPAGWVLGTPELAKAAMAAVAGG